MRNPPAVLQCIRRKLNLFLDNFSPSIHSSAFYLGMSTFAKTRFCSHRDFVSTCLRRSVIPVGFRISTRPCLGRISKDTIEQNLLQCSRRLMRLSLESYHREVDHHNSAIAERRNHLDSLCNRLQFGSIRMFIHNLNQLMFIVIPVLSCFIGFVLLLLLIMCIRQLRGRRMELSTRGLQTPSSHPTMVGTVRSDHTEGTYKTTVSETYEIMENRRVDKGPVHSYLLPSTTHGGDTLRSVPNHPQRPAIDAGALPLDNQGYTPMDPTHEGVYMTHLGHGPACPTQVDVGDITCGSKYANLETCPDATDIQPDDTDYDDVSVYGTYTTSEGALHHEYLEEASHAPKLMETAL